MKNEKWFDHFEFQYFKPRQQSIIRNWWEPFTKPLYLTCNAMTLNLTLNYSNWTNLAWTPLFLNIQIRAKFFDEECFANSSFEEGSITGTKNLYIFEWHFSVFCFFGVANIIGMLLWRSACWVPKLWITTRYFFNLYFVYYRQRGWLRTILTFKLIFQFTL